MTVSEEGHFRADMAEGSGRGEFKPNLGGGRGTAFFVNVHAAVVGELWQASGCMYVGCMYVGCMYNTPPSEWVLLTL